MSLICKADDIRKWAEMGTMVRDEGVEMTGKIRVGDIMVESMEMGKQEEQENLWNSGWVAREHYADSLCTV